MAKAHDIEVFDQDDPCWEDMPFLKDSGCGILAFRNALAALNGCRPDVCELADWAIAIGAYRPDEAGLYRKTFYDNVEQAYGEKLGFSLAGQYWGAITDEGLTEHLLSGGTAVVHVPNHFLALVDYDAQTGRYRVLESKCSLLRFLRKDGLVSADKLSRGNTQVDWYVLIESRKQE